ncbi:MAG: hypothetical protein Q4B85_13120 [Lachnospiraceae bacterium]|nr:hypothetical protein [Lachnospiraceae bacterium]
MKTIGFVCEGPRDSDMLEAIARHILQEDISSLYLQPESSLLGENGNGWKGVWTWCVKNGETFDQLIEGAMPQPDMVIIQMDGDVARKEKEVHCSCHATACVDSGHVFPLNCNMLDCPVTIPCHNHEGGTEGYVSLLREMLLSYFQGQHIPVCVIPCDSTDVWIVAAYDEMENIESIEDPWVTIISRAKEYHGIRIPGHKKTRNVYQKLIPKVCSEWEKVKTVCPQAEYFDQAIRSIQ